MPSIKVHNAQRKLRLSLVQLQHFAERALELCLRQPRPTMSELKTLDEVSIILVSDRRIAALHGQFMKMAGPTDVITFQHGEIFISVEVAQRQARQFGTEAEDEIRLYLVHGLLHLHGLDDRTPEDAREMERVQAMVVAAAGAA